MLLVTISLRFSLKHIGTSINSIQKGGQSNYRTLLGIYKFWYGEIAIIRGKYRPTAELVLVVAGADNNKLITVP